MLVNVIDKYGSKMAATKPEVLIFQLQCSFKGDTNFIGSMNTMRLVGTLRDVGVSSKLKMAAMTGRR